MPLTESERADLFESLEARGWFWRDDTIYAPNSSMWLLGQTPWVGDLVDFHERMCGRLQRNENHGWLCENAQDHDDLVMDTRSLVEVLTRMLSRRRQ